MNDWPTTNPVVIGGVGGSGTRLVASLLLGMNFYMGGHLNEALDSRWAGRLLDIGLRQQYYTSNEVDWTRLFNLITERHMAAGRANWYQWYSSLALAQPSAIPLGRRHGLKIILNTLHLLSQPAWPAPAGHGWGWKTPKSHLALPQIAAHFPQLRYIHVIRHGLDMAYSRNLAQLRQWGVFFGIAWPKARRDVPPAALRYWVKANQRAQQLGIEMGSERFLWLCFDDLCLEPAVNIKRLADFVGVDVAATDLTRLSQLVQPPSSRGRYRNHPWQRLPEADIAGVRQLGFRIDEEKVR